MRIACSVLFAILSVVMAVCAALANRSHKPIKKDVVFLLLGFIPPILGNMIIIASSSRLVAVIGYYIYIIGMDIVVLALFKFSFNYCNLMWKRGQIKILICIIYVIDVVQTLLNILFHHAFKTKETMVDGFSYHDLTPNIGLVYHRIMCYGLLLAIIIIFAYKTAKASRVYSEKYYTLLISIIITAVLETIFIFSNMTIDISMFALALSGLLIFFFALYYRPMRFLDRMLSYVVSDMNEGMFLFDNSDNCLWINDGAVNLMGAEKDNPGASTELLKDIFGDVISNSGDWAAKRTIETEDGNKYYVINKYSVTDDNDNIIGSMVSVRDNTLEHNARLKELYDATHDKLTGLYTKEYLFSRIKKELRRYADVPYYVIYVDVRNFKIVNDIFGSDFGDYALNTIAKLIGSFEGEHFIYGRLAGDTFGAAVPVDEFDADYIDQILNDFVVRRDSVEHHILIHLGVYEVTDTNIDVSVMFDRAHLALGTIKEDYNRHIAYYDDEMRNKILWNQIVTTELNTAIRSKQMRPYLQPIVDREGKIIGAEALVRWIHPDLGFMSPGDFIPLFEENGRIIDVDRYMWRSVCEILKRWEKEGRDQFISVNISPKDFYFMDVETELNHLVKEYNIDKKKLRIEITESVMMNDADQKMKVIDNLKVEGFIVEMDDFGSGYSSFNLFKDMSVDVLKIDMMFLAKSKDIEKARKIVRHIISMTKDLGIVSLTEGVETENDYKELREMGCDLFQGYYFSKPIPIEDFEKLSGGLSGESD